MEKKINILHVGIDSHLGGIETYLKKITTYINKEKYQFDFLSYEGTEPCYYNELKALGCNFYFIHSRKQNYLKNRKDLENLFLDKKFDIVHCHLNSLSYITPCLIALKHNCKVIIHSRNAGCIGSLKSKILHKINYYRISNLNIERVAVSDLAGKWMFNNKKFVVLNNGLDVNKYKFSEEHRKEIRTELGIDDETEIILHVGAFRKQKNHEFIVKIFKEYQALHTNAILILVGDGELKQHIYNNIKEENLLKNCMFIGQRNDIYKFLSAADKFIFPSFYEGFPNALIEAETAGLLCVVSDVITSQAIIDGIAYKNSLNESINSWVKSLERNKINDRHKCAEIVKNNKFDIKDEIKRLENLYTSII